MRFRVRASVLGLGLLGLGLAACGGSSSSSSSTTTTTAVPTTSTSVAAAGGAPAGCAQAAQLPQSLGQRIQSAAASGNTQALSNDINRAIAQFRSGANTAGAPPAVKSALNNMSSSLQALLNASTQQQRQQAAQSFASGVQQFVTACT